MATAADETRARRLGDVQAGVAGDNDHVQSAAKRENGSILLGSAARDRDTDFAHRDDRERWGPEKSNEGKNKFQSSPASKSNSWYEETAQCQVLRWCLAAVVRPEENEGSWEKCGKVRRFLMRGRRG